MFYPLIACYKYDDIEVTFGITYHNIFLKMEFTDYSVSPTTGFIERWKERRAFRDYKYFL